MNYLYAALGGIALIVAAFFYGEHVQKQADVAKADTVLIRQDSKLNTLTQTQTLAAATHVQTIQANGFALHQNIAQVFAPSGVTHATYAPADPLDSDSFRVCYDAASRGERACQAGDVLPLSPANSQPPSR